MKFQIYNGDSIEILKDIPDNSIDSLVTDPPAGIGLQDLDWDENKGGRKEWIEWLTKIMVECHRVLKPGAHGFVWAIPRTSHWTATALEDAGFQVRDIVTHLFGSGFPKNTSLDKAIANAKYTNTADLFRATEWIRNRRNQLGLTNKMINEIAEVRGGACHWTACPPDGQANIPPRERWVKLEKVFGPPPDWLNEMIMPSYESLEYKKIKDLKSREQSLKWKGWGTALKPASEHWILIQKPISEHNLASNVIKYGVGGINIDEVRIPVSGKIPSTTNLNFKDGGFIWEGGKRSRTSFYEQHPKGRFPSNIIITKSEEDRCPSQYLEEQNDKGKDVSKYFKTFQSEVPFYYCKKPDQKEKDYFNTHPTVKPTRLMKYLIKMVTPENGCILDPFMGSGSTGLAALSDKFGFIGIEKNESYFEIARQRLEEFND